MKKIILFLLTAFCLSGCLSEESINVEQDRIWTYYELLYDANQDVTYVIAQFKFGNGLGTLLKLSSPSEILFNGEKLAYEQFSSSYTKSFAGKITSGTFVFRDVNEKEFVNPVNLSKPIDFPAITEISKSSALTIEWIGDPVGTNEEVWVLMGGAGAENVNLASQTAPSSTSVIVGKDRLESLTTTKIDLLMDRIINSPLSASTSAGGSLVSKFRAYKANVAIK